MKTFVLLIFGSILFSLQIIAQSLKDVDGNEYHTVSIGYQVWMKENLKVTHYRNGDKIENITDNEQWTNLKTGAYCKYDNNCDLSDTFGLLYNWYAVADKRGLCPEGWHVPSDAEWYVLTDYLFDEGIPCSILKEKGTKHWKAPNKGANDDSDFTALPGGYRGYYYGSFHFLGSLGSWWTSRKYSDSFAWSRSLTNNSRNIMRYFSSRRNGFSVRCVRNILKT